MLSHTRSLCLRFLEFAKQQQRRSRQQAAIRKTTRRRAFFEPLEARQVLTAPMFPPVPPPEPDHPGANIDQNGNLLIHLATSAAFDNQFTIRQDGAGNVFLTDTQLQFSNPGNFFTGQLSDNNHTLRIPMTTISGGRIFVNGGDGDDRLTVDLSGGNPIPVGGLIYAGGLQSSETGDSLELTSGTVDSVEYGFINQHDGWIDIDGRRLDYTGLEPITDTTVANNRTLTYTGGAETIAITDDVVGDGQIKIASSLGESLSIPAPLAALTIVTSAGDVTNINSFDPGFNTPLISLQSTAGASNFNLGAANLIPDATGLSLTGDATFSLNGFSETIASLASTDALPKVILSASQTLTVGNASNTTFSGEFATGSSGSLTKVGAGTLILSGASPNFTGTSTVNAGVLQIDQANSSGTGPTVINSTGTFAINNVTHNAAVALNNGGTLLGMGTAARENGVVTIAASAATGVTLAASAGSTLTLSDAANDLTGGAGTTITVNGGGVVALTQNSNAGTAASPLKWNINSGSVLSITAALQLGLAPTAHTATLITLNNGTLRNAATAAAIDLTSTRGFTLGASGGTIDSTGSQNITIGGKFTGAAPLNVTGVAAPALILNGNTTAGTNQFTALNINVTRFFMQTNPLEALGSAPITITGAGQFGNLNSAPPAITNPFTLTTGARLASRSTGTNVLTLSGLITLPTSGSIVINNEATANGTIAMTNPANAVALTGDLTIQVGPNAAGPGQLDINHLFSGSSGIIKTQTGILQLTNNANTYTGPTQFNGGSILVPNLALINTGGVPSPLGAGTNVAASLQFGGGFLRYPGGDFTFNRNYTVNAGIGGFEVSTAGAVLSLSGSGTGAGGLSKAGPGTLRLLANTSDYTGTGTIVEGTLLLTTNNGLPTASSLTVGSGTTVGTFDMATFNQTLAGLGAASNSAANNIVTVNTGRTLTVNGNVNLANNTDGASTNLIINGGGSLAVTGATFFVGNNTGGTNISSNASLDLTALASFTATMSTSLVVQAAGDNNAARFATLKLSNTANTITAATVTVGASATAGVNQLFLGGGTNVINTNTLNIGTGSRDSGSITFPGATGSLTVRNQAGTGAAVFNMGTGTATTGANGTNTFDVAGHSADLLFGASAIATQPRSAPFVNTFTFDTGTLTMTSLAMGTVGNDTAANGVGPRVQTATMNLGGGTVNITNGITNLGSINGTGYTDATKPRTVTANLNISGGTVNIGATGGNSVTMATMNLTGTGQLAAVSSNANINITGGTTTFAGNLIRGTLAGTSTGGVSAAANVNINGGVVNFSAKTVGTTALPIGFTFAAGTISNLANTNGGANLVKTTAADGIITGTNALPGTTVASAGTLYINGTVGPLTIDPAIPFSPGTTATNVGLAIVTGNYTQNGPLTIQISSPGSSTPGTDYDEVKVVGSGSVTIGAAATLSVVYTGTAGTFAGNTGQQYILIDNDGTDTIPAFTGIAEGSTITIDGMAMKVSYVGNDGNDMTLTAVGGPPPIIYIDDDYAGAAGTIVDGDLETPTMQNATLGTNAFASIAAAMTAYPTFAGTMYVNGGTYASAPFAGGNTVTIRLLQDLVTVPNEVDVTLQNLTGSAGDLIVTRFLGAANANLIVEQGSYAGVISGAGNFTKSSAGTLTLGGVNTYAGSTNIADGTLQLGIDNAFPTTAAISIGGLGAPTATPVTTTATLNLGAFSQTLASLNSTANSTTANVVTIGAGETLTLTAGMSLGIASTNAATGSPVTNTVLRVNGAGTLSISGTTISVGVNSSGANFSHVSQAELDVSGLGAFNVNVTNFNVGVGTTTVPKGTLKLSNTANTILATTFKISDTGANNGNGEVVVTLGTGTNVLQVDTLQIGRGKSVGGLGALLQFASQAAGSPGTVSISNKAGTGTAIIDIANNIGTGTAGGTVGTLDLRGHVATVSASTVTLSTLNQTSTGGTTGTLRFDAGTFTVDTVTMSPKTNTGTGAAVSNLSVGGGTFTANTAINFGSQATAGTSVPTINVTGGTLVANANIVKGAGAVTATINLSGGTLNMTNKTIGSTAAPVVFNFTGGTLQSLAEFNDGAAISKTGAGTATIAGTNAFTGATTVTAGTLAVTGTIVSAPTVQTGATLTGTGTTGLLTVNASGIHAPGTNVGITTVNGTYVNNGTLQIQIGSASGATAGTDYDHVRILNSGSVNIVGATLVVSYTPTAGTFNPTFGNSYIIINNDGNLPSDTVGNFSGLAEGATVTVDGKPLTLTYVGGDGNDVALVVPAPTILYVDDDFPATGTVDGDLETAGTQSAVMGTTAFQSIAAALAANPGFSGTFVVNGGVYASALLAGGGNVTLRLVQDLLKVPNELDVQFNDLSGDAGDAIVTRFNNTANANLLATQGAFSGVISGSGGLTKSTAGTVNLLGTNTYTGVTTVSAGTLRVTGSIATSTTTVQTGATIDGVGTTGPLTINAGGIHSPGVTTSLLTTQGNYVNNGGLTIQIGSASGTAAGTDYDQVRITGSGSVALGGTSTLTVTYTGGGDVQSDHQRPLHHHQQRWHRGQRHHGCLQWHPRWLVHLCRRQSNAGAVSGRRWQRRGPRRADHHDALRQRSIHEWQC